MPNLLEVLGWWVQTLPKPGSKGLTLSRLPLANHACVEESSIARWIREQKVPKGETIFRVGFFLEAFFGLEIEEMDGSKESEVRKLTRTFGSGAISMEVLSDMLDFADRADSVTRLLRGTCGTSQNRLQKIRIINLDYASQVNTVRKSIEQMKPHLGPKSNVENVEFPGAQHSSHLKHVKTLVQSSRVKNGMSVEEEIACLLQTLSGLNTILSDRLNHFLSDEFTSEQRQSFREKTGEKLVFENSNKFYQLYNMLSALCSESARKSWKGE